MTTIMVADFSGMTPIRNPLLLPDNVAAFAENTWLYTGKVRGFRHANPVYAIQYADTKSVYRIPTSTVNPPDFTSAGSLWFEFPDPYMSVVRNPTVGDQYNRYYFFPSDQYASTGVNPDWPVTRPPPQYRTVDPVTFALGPLLDLGIPNPAVAPGVTPNAIPPDETRHYLYTWLDNTGINGPPSPDESADGLVTGTWTITIPPAITSADMTAMVGVNLWRSVTSGSTLTYHLIYGPAINPVQFLSFADNLSDAYVAAQPQLTAYDATLPQPTIGVGIVAAVVPAQETRAYVYTYVSVYSEEGPPSPATVEDGQTTGTWVITMTCPTAAQMANTNLCGSTGR
jgi:hypothetical protein